MVVNSPADKPNSKRTFIGRAWINEVKKEGASKGVKFLNVTRDKGFEDITLKASDSLQLWPNPKREGKRDADFRLSVVSAEDEVAAQVTA